MFSYTLTILLNQIHHPPPSYITPLTYPLHPLCHILSRIVYLPLHATMPKYFSSTFTWIKTYTPAQALIEGSQNAISISITTLIILTFHTPPPYLIPYPFNTRQDKLIICLTLFPPIISLLLLTLIIPSLKIYL
jgi:hypothetical protein